MEPGCLRSVGRDECMTENTFYSARLIMEEGEIKQNRIIQAKTLWKEFGDILMNPETECIEAEWNGFPAGTHREVIWHWFEETFDVSVAEDLMGL